MKEAIFHSTIFSPVSAMVLSVSIWRINKYICLGILTLSVVPWLLYSLTIGWDGASHLTGRRGTRGTLCLILLGPWTQHFLFPRDSKCLLKPSCPFHYGPSFSLITVHRGESRSQKLVIQGSINFPFAHSASNPMIENLCFIEGKCVSKKKREDNSNRI